MQSRITVRIRNATPSSVALPPASNLQCEIVLLNSMSAVFRSGDDGFMRPHVKKECSDDKAADVMGAVAN